MKFMIVKHQNGFTLVELAVVVAVIGILAGVVSIGFGSWQQNLAKSQVQSDMKQVASAMESAKNFNNAYPTTLPTSFKASPDITITYKGGNATSYCIEAKSDKYSSVAYYIDSQSKDPKEGTCGGMYALAAPSPSISASSNTSLTVTWSAVSQATSYSVKYGTSNPNVTASCSSSPCIINGLSSTTTYKITVTALNALKSETSPVISGTTAGPGYKSVAAGASHTCAINVEDAVYCWGNGVSGQLGNGSYGSSTVPVAVSTAGVLNGKTVKAISTWSNHTCVIASDNKAYCWGDNANGQLGDGTQNKSAVPVAVNANQVLSGKSIVSISAGLSYTCAAASDGGGYCWGDNTYNQLTSGSSGRASLVPVTITQGALPASGIKVVSSAFSYTCAIAQNDKEYCWGGTGSNLGQMGNGNTSGSATPVAVVQGEAPANSSTNMIASGQTQSCAIVSNNRIYCRGRTNNEGYGESNFAGTTTPYLVAQGEMPSGAAVKAITTNDPYACAIAVSDSKTYCWGYNGYGQLGDGTTTGRRDPVTVLQGSIPSGVTTQKVSAGLSHVCIVASNNRVYCWGNNANGQFGNNSTTNSYSPTASNLY